MQNPQPHQLSIARRSPFAAPGIQVPLYQKTGVGSRPAPAIAILLKALAPAVLTLCLWSKLWLGVVAATLLCVAALIAVVFGPRLFERAGDRITWARQVGFGEKIWLNRLVVPVPKDLSYRLTMLYLVFWSGAIVALWGGVSTLPILSVTGLLVAYSTQMVCFKKLIHLYRIMKDKYPLYRFWAATAGNDNEVTASKRASRVQRSA